MHGIEDKTQFGVAQALPVHQFFERIEIWRARFEGVNQIFARRKRWDASFQDESKLLFNLRDDRRKRAAAVARLVFDSVPTVGIVTRGDDDAAGGLVVPHQK